MLSGVNIEKIKEYNASIRAYKEKSSSLTAEIKFNTQELNNLCAELTHELGVEVTPENVEKIYNERVESILETLKSGNEIIARIEQEEREQSATSVSNQSVFGNTPTGGPVPPQMAFSGAPVGMGTPNNSSPFGDLPPIFQNRG
ncbi:MAG: hypothetical protein J6A59_14205 [Lachnospiraceae bacterium]|nr:hypothetical protein [Lachnospiraceae bacterium]